MREFIARSGLPVIEKPFLPGDVRDVIAQVATKRFSSVDPAGS